MIRKYTTVSTNLNLRVGLGKIVERPSWTVLPGSVKLVTLKTWERGGFCRLSRWNVIHFHRNGTQEVLYSNAFGKNSCYARPKTLACIGKLLHVKFPGADNLLFLWRYTNSKLMLKMVVVVVMIPTRQQLRVRHSDCDKSWHNWQKIRPNIRVRTYRGHCMYMNV